MVKGYEGYGVNHWNEYNAPTGIPSESENLFLQAHLNDRINAAQLKFSLEISHKPGGLMEKYVSYQRCSTEEQSRSNLGLKSQEEVIKSYIESNEGVLVKSFLEVGSGSDKIGRH